ncbi:hypothetical protein [Roseococcus pinisoli]|uniref:Uncharacterized protein n=1 Tax=Roseococcus pinisoli TaxID=2835040 RepID=A0ABS5Q722_9PROT|nr:hypothetical protein [Roseococcus pinisoli]MBS7809380.1 hypothetical protein [Roseococcus pinisoli]
MRRFLIASALGLGILSGGAASGTAEAAPFNPGRVELGAGVTPVQYYGHYHPRPHYRPRYYAPPPPRYYAPPPRHYGYYAPPPPPRYYRPHHHRPYYGWR